LETKIRHQTLKIKKKTRFFLITQKKASTTMEGCIPVEKNHAQTIIMY